jgi:hypothetical protein
MQEEMRNAYTILVRIPEEERMLGRHNHKWKNNIKSVLKKQDIPGSTTLG